jgi:CRISPR-associated protein Csx3
MGSALISPPRNKGDTILYYNIEISERLPDGSIILKIGFGEPTQNDDIVRDAEKALKSLDLKGGPRVFLNGPASLPVAVGIAHDVAHLFGSVFVFDPKMAAYICAVSHTSDYKRGDVVKL